MLPTSVGSAQAVAAPPCSTAEVSIAFDFPGASSSRCVINGPRSFSILVSPEHAPPINPSPWYAFRYRATAGEPVKIALQYLGATHRYSPKLSSKGVVTDILANVEDDGRTARLTLPVGEGILSAQPLVDAASYGEFVRRLEDEFGARRVTLGQSLDGRPIEALRFGDDRAPAMIVILGRQHPPEVTGSYALERFVTELARTLLDDPRLARRYQLFVVPQINPDGVALGHWRANRAGVDLNRDWGPFTQPETRAVRAFLDHLPAATRPVAMIDFHSTGRNLFYVQGDEASDAQRRFLTLWLEGMEDALPGYRFTLERRNANPGSGTAKNWFHAVYAIPAYTYEVGDNSVSQPVAEAARILADRLLPALEQSFEPGQD